MITQRGGHRQALPCPPRVMAVSFALQKYNADYDLSATQEADTLAFVSLLEEKLLPVLVRLPVETTWGTHTHTVAMPVTRTTPWSNAGGLHCTPTCQERQRMWQVAKSWGSGVKDQGAGSLVGLCS